MIARALLHFGNQLQALIYPWAVIGIASYTWLRKCDTPVHRTAWSLFMALCIVVLFNPVHFLVVEVLSGGVHPAPRPLVYSVGIGLVGLFWAVLTKIFFRRATVMQVALTTLCGVAYEVWRTRAWLELAFNAVPRKGA
jgi:hypothetical protein